VAAGGRGLRFVHERGIAGYPADVPDEERRCPSCQALVAADATWCGQCYASLVVPPRRDEPAPAPPLGGVTDGGERTAAYWPCPVCGARNPIEADTCVTCGTPFAQVMRDATPGRTVDPKDAVTASLVFPGLGHRKVGRGTDGLARGVLFALSFGMAMLVGISGTRSPALFLVFVLFLATALAVYAFSAYEASRLAKGGDLLISSRVLLWVLVGLVMLSTLLLAMAVVTANRG